MTDVDFRYYLRVRYSECDAQKIVYNGRYSEYVDLATTEFLRAMALGDSMISGQFDYKTVRQSIDWRASARFDDVLEISVRTLNLGNTSFSASCEFRRAGSTDVIATSETVYVMVDAVTLDKTPIPGHLREILQRGAPGKQIDHAGWLPRG
ncbi:MAG: acyl-CoA thioesterase [Pirellulales bacterium]|nr:acyl-CoA thioesterase [Pirellulales bacterium]